MPQRRLLYLTASRLVASHWSAGTLHEEARFAPDSEGLAAFASHLARHRRSIFYLMADIAEEGFLIEMLPYTQGADRRALLARIAAPQARCLLMTLTQSGIRQSYFEYGQIKFSRLTPLATSGAEDI